MLTGASRGDFAVKCPEGSTEISLGNSLAATIEAGPGNLFGLNTGMTGDDLEMHLLEARLSYRNCRCQCTQSESEGDLSFCVEDQWAIV